MAEKSNNLFILNFKHEKITIQNSIVCCTYFYFVPVKQKIYSTDKGDLLRVGFIANTDNYDFTKLFANDYQKKIKFTKFSDLDLKKQNHFTTFVIGDSFSDQGCVGYQNYLADNPNVKVLNLDKYLHTNPIETVYGLLNGDVLDSIKTDYIIIQSVERELLKRAKNLNVKTEIKKEALTKLINKHKEKGESKKKEDQFFCKSRVWVASKYYII